MDPQQLTHGLRQLADEAEPRPVDVHVIMAIARARTKTRRAALATGLGTVALVGTLVVVVGFVATSESSPVAAPPSSSLAESTPKQPPVGLGPTADDRSAKLDEQLAAAKLIPAQYTVEPNPESSAGPLQFRGSKGPKEMNYTARAVLRDAEGTAIIQIWVLKNPPGTALDHYYGQVFRPCTVGEKNCERHELPDGTVATTQVNARPPALTLSSTLSAQRPDGTYIQVLTNVGEGEPPQRPIPPLTVAELIKFATAFTY